MRRGHIYHLNMATKQVSFSLDQALGVAKSVSIWNFDN